MWLCEVWVWGCVVCVCISIQNVSKYTVHVKQSVEEGEEKNIYNNKYNLFKACVHFAALI